MDNIRLERVDSPFGFHFPSVAIWINDVPLTEWVAQHDAEQAKMLDHIVLIDLNKAELLTHNAKTEVLCCTCGEIGCGSFRVSIQLDQNTVCWTPIFEHQQGRNWVFDRTAYQKQIEQIFIT